MGRIEASMISADLARIIIDGKEWRHRVFYSSDSAWPSDEAMRSAMNDWAIVKWRQTHGWDCPGPQIVWVA